MSHNFPKTEKLKSRKTIELLFSQGKSVTKFPIKLIYLPTEAPRTQVTFAVPKRNFKLAVSRNRIKRQLREAYRLQKQEVLHNNSPTFALLFLYLSKDNVSYEKMEASVKQLLKKVYHENS